ncbi:hypothetical protein CHS0354_006825 [Potamilus streckersoni]|uniref:Pseudouridine-5'-phosphate glycosidase n=1 Tax=Potamilus streckersoni TaxID=2493646 RepID=A0AAE0TED9_9BIVA|nr:hypothetical protein CHS0354_006825 [Potamilus streckersoni]
MMQSGLTVLPSVMTQPLPPFIQIAEHIQEALYKNLPVVALESAVISHGMPYPENRVTALMTEKIIRTAGAVPATIAVIDGVIKVGLTAGEMDRLAQDKNTLKLSSRDVLYAAANRLTGGTTVAGTLYVCRTVGIRFFVAGGIGGVNHRPEHKFDISADLLEMSRSPVVVISSGYEFPAFFSRKSGCKIPYHFGDIDSLAKTVHTYNTGGYPGGILIANPIPEEFAQDRDVIDAIIDRAIDAAAEEGISGKDLTPYLLKKINTDTEGESLNANIALIRHNADIGAQLAARCYQLETSAQK